MFQISTGLRDGLLTGDDFVTMIGGGLIKIYSGTVPSAADDDLGSAVLLNTISDAGGGTGLSFEAASVDGVLSKLSTQVWSGIAEASGTASFYRFAPIADDGTASTTDFRMQGTVGVLNEDLILAVSTQTIGVDQAIHYYSVGMPVSA